MVAYTGICLCDIIHSEVAVVMLAVCNSAVVVRE